MTQNVVQFSDDTPAADRFKLEEFVKHEHEPLTISSVIELPNKHRYQYTPVRDSTGDYTYNFERIT